MYLRGSRSTIQRVFLLSLLAAVAASTAAAQDVQEPATPRTPVSYGIVVDNSGSLRTKLDRVVRSVMAMIESNGPDDEAFLVTFVDTDNIHVRQEMTSDTAQLTDAANNMYIQGGKTAFIDALKLSIDHLSENARTEPGRLRRLVVITDGDDTGSKTKLVDLSALLKEKQIPVLVLAISDLQVHTKTIDRVVKDSGGRKYQPKLSNELESSLKAITADLRTQF
jgi:Ca-activated chloride channel family protein